MYILNVYSMQYTFRWNTNVRKFPLDKISSTKNPCFFLLRAPTHHSCTLNLWFLYELKHKVRLSKTLCGVFHFWIFLFSKIHGLFYFKTSCFLSKLNDRKATQSFAPRPLIFKLQQEVWKFSDICMCWRPPKTDLVTNSVTLITCLLLFLMFLFF